MERNTAGDTDNDIGYCTGGNVGEKKKGLLFLLNMGTPDPSYDGGGTPISTCDAHGNSGADYCKSILGRSTCAKNGVQLSCSGACVADFYNSNGKCVACPQGKFNDARTAGLTDISQCLSRPLAVDAVVVGDEQVLVTFDSAIDSTTEDISYYNISMVKESCCDTDMVVNSRGVTDYGRLDLTGGGSYTEISLCVWMQTSEVSSIKLQAIVSWSPATGTAYKLFLLGLGKSTSSDGRIHLVLEKPGDGSSIVDIKNVGPIINDGNWHHVCTSVSTSGGDCFLLIDNQKYKYMCPTSEVSIPRDGIVIVGQEQDTPGAGFQVEAAFVGRISRLRMYSQAFDMNTLMLYETQPAENFIIALMSSFNIYGNTQILPTTLTSSCDQDCHSVATESVVVTPAMKTQQQHQWQVVVGGGTGINTAVPYAVVVRSCNKDAGCSRAPIYPDTWYCVVKAYASGEKRSANDYQVVKQTWSLDEAHTALGPRLGPKVGATVGTNQAIIPMVGQNHGDPHDLTKSGPGWEMQWNNWVRYNCYWTEQHTNFRYPTATSF